MDNPETNELTSSLAYLAGLGTVTAVGGNLAMTAAAINAGISSYQISDFYNENDQPVTMSLVPPAFFSELKMDIDEGELYGEQDEHVIKMAVCAIREALGSREFTNPVPLILAFPEPFQNNKPGFSENLINNLLAQPDLPVSAVMIKSLHTGRAAGLEAIALGMRYLFEQHHDYVLVGASDSFFHCNRLSELALQDRLLANQNMDGFAPGEAAGFLLLTRHRDQALMQQQQAIAIVATGLAMEQGYILNDQQNHTGDGLDRAIKQAMAKHDNIPVGDIFSSMNGERYWSKEHGVAMIRNQALLDEEVKIHHPADCYGDLGAASGPVMTMLAAHQLWKNGDGKQTLVYCASEGPHRAALCLRKA